MIVRLWWKEMRQFWAIWLFLAIASIVTQALVLSIMGDDARTGLLPAMALGWTCLYGFAVGAASFAGERETQTLRLLDTIPVPRERLWTAKSSFAMLSTLALGLVLFIAAWNSTEQWKVGPNWTIPWAILAGIAALLGVVGWGLFWSSFLNSALAAAVLAIFTSLLSIPVADIGRNLDQEIALNPYIHLAIAVLAMLGSAAFFLRTGPPARPLIRRALRKRESTQRVAEAQSRSGLATIWPHAAWRLAWETVREISRVSWRIFLVSLVLPLLLRLWTGVGTDPVILAGFGLTTGLMCGVNVFGITGREHTHRFLAHHGVRPGLVWTMKMIVWGAFLLLLTIPMLFIALNTSNSPYGHGPNDFLLTLYFLAFGVSIAVLCGMAVRRELTAALLSLIAFIVVAGPLAVCFGMGILHGGHLVVATLIPLVISRLWAADWMDDRPGGARWIRLASYIVGAALLMLAVYIPQRAWEIPELDPAKQARLFMFTTPIVVPAPELNAAPLYRKAMDGLRPGLVTNIVPNDADALLSDASQLPYCQGTPLDRMSVFSPTGLPDLGPGIDRLSGVVTRRTERGELAAAWSDVLVMLRIARQWCGAVPLSQARQGLSMERKALGRAMAWAESPKLTRAILDEAIKELRSLPAMPDRADTIRAETILALRTLDLPSEELAIQRSDAYPAAKELHWTNRLRDVSIMPPWERVRARRGFRLLFASWIEQAARMPAFEPGERWQYFGGLGFFVRDGDESLHYSASDLEQIARTTPLVRELMPGLQQYLSYSDRNEVARQALTIILALRAYQLRHDSRLPASLQDLPDKPPTDPYNHGRPFGYIPSSGQTLLPLGDLEPSTLWVQALKRPMHGKMLLYSIGPDGRDDHAAENDDGAVSRGDIVFPLTDKP